MNPSFSTPDKPRIRPHRCPACLVGHVIPTARDGRFFAYKEVVINLPKSVFIPECVSCGQLFPTAEVDAEVKRVLEEEYKRDEVVIAKALERLRRRRGIN
jgi:hypothetical protein